MCSTNKDFEFHEKTDHGVFITGIIGSRNSEGFIFSDALTNLEQIPPPKIPPAQARMIFEMLDGWMSELVSPNKKKPLELQLLTKLIFLTHHKKSKQAIPLAKHLIETGDEKSAADLLATLLSIYPQGGGYFNAVLLLKDGETRERVLETHLKRLTELGKGDPSTLALHATQLIQLKKTTEALALTAEFHETDHREIMLARATALFWNNQFREAEEILGRALKLDSWTKKDLSSLASLCVKNRIALGNIQELTSLLDTLQKDPRDFALPPQVLTFANLAAGKLEDAFTPYATPSATKSLLLLNRNVLTLEEMKLRHSDEKTRKGSCAIFCSMGVGDEIRFASMIPEIRELFESTTLYCDPRLVSIFARSFPGIRLEGLNFNKAMAAAQTPPPGTAESLSANEFAAYDRVADLKQFSALLRCKVANFPDTGHHLRPRPDLCQEWKEYLAATPHRKIGLFWGSRLISYDAQHKQTRLADWLSGLAGMDLQIVPLQYELTAEEEFLMNADSRFLRVDRLFDVKNDFEQTCALLAALPVVVSLPGSTQHMAGAVGTKVLCPTHPFEANWRKLHGRSHETWSPSVEIICGAPEGGMRDSMARCIERLHRLL